MSAWKEAKDGTGRTYYWNTATKQTRWDKPEDFDAPDTPSTPAAPPTPARDPAEIDGAWQEAERDGKKYYYNAITRQTSWKPPPAYVQRQQAGPPPGPTFVAGGGQGFPRDNFERRVSERDHGLPPRPNMDGGRPWEQRQENMGFRGPMPVKTDDPEYATFELAEEAFFKLLRRHSISSDAKWEEALHTVVREREYRALKDPKERRQAFEKYCETARVEEKTKEKERREKQREDFRKMLTTHDDIKYFTRWKTARALIEREAEFKAMSDEDHRKQVFGDYILQLRKEHAEDRAALRKDALQDLDHLLRALITDSNTKWEDAQDGIFGSDRFATAEKAKAISKHDALIKFDNHVKSLDQAKNAAKQTEKRLRFRTARKARDTYRELLDKLVEAGEIGAWSQWQTVYPLVEKDDRYLNLLGTPGSTPLDIFWDIVEGLDHDLRTKRLVASQVLHEDRYEVTASTSLDEFADLMRSDSRTAQFGVNTVKGLHKMMVEKAKQHAEDEEASKSRDRSKAVDELRSIIKHLEPPIRIDDSYEDIAPKLQRYREYEILSPEERKKAFDKHLRRLKEKEREHRDRGREHGRREKDRSYRNGSRREYDREYERDHEHDRERRRGTRTPEPDAYEADRRKAQADRERQYRKPSFGLTPPPRSRRDDREESYRRTERRSTVYDHERHERERERERNYVSRADPRDRGRSSLDYGDDDAYSSRPSSTRKRRESDGSLDGRRDPKRLRSGNAAPSPERAPKEDEPALQSGSEEGEIEEV